MKNHSKLISRAVILLLLCSTSWVHAQDCYSLLDGRSVNLLVPFKPGGGTDRLARTIASVVSAQTAIKVRVSNLTGGSSRAVQRAIAGKQDASVIGLFDATYFAKQALHPAEKNVPALEEFRVLVGVRDEPSVLTSNTQTRLLGGDQTILFAGVPDLYLMLPLLSRLTGTEITPIKGYKGSKMTINALRKKEVDMVWHSLTTILNAYRRSPGLHLELVTAERSDIPAELVAMELDYLIGPGGWIDRHSRDDPARVKLEKRRIGDLFKVLGRNTRAIFVSALAPPQEIRCMSDAFSEVLQTPRFAQQVTAQKLSFKFSPGVSLEQELRENLAYIQANSDLIQHAD